MESETCQWSLSTANGVRDLPPTLPYMSTQQYRIWCLLGSEKGPSRPGVAVRGASTLSSTAIPDRSCIVLQTPAAGQRPRLYSGDCYQHAGGGHRGLFCRQREGDKQHHQPRGPGGRHVGAPRGAAVRQPLRHLPGFRVRPSGGLPEPYPGRRSKDRAPGLLPSPLTTAHFKPAMSVVLPGCGLAVSLAAHI